MASVFTLALGLLIASAQAEPGWATHLPTSSNELQRHTTDLAERHGPVGLAGDSLAYPKLRTLIQRGHLPARLIRLPAGADLHTVARRAERMGVDCTIWALTSTADFAARLVGSCSEEAVADDPTQAQRIAARRTAAEPTTHDDTRTRLSLPRFHPVRETAWVFGLIAEGPVTQSDAEPDPVFGKSYAVPGLSPVLGAQLDLGTPSWGLLTSIEITPTFIYYASHSGCCVGLAKAVAAPRVTVGSWDIGPYGGVGFIVFEAGLRAATAPWVRRPSGRPVGIELRVGYLYPYALEVSVLARRIRRSKARPDR